MKHAPALLFLLCGLIFLAAGCGDGRPKRVPVSGQVLIDGQPVSQGFIQVVPDRARPAIGKLDSQGRFRLETYGEGDGCVLGTHRVAVIAIQTLSPTAVRWLTPPEYRDPATSGVAVEIVQPEPNLVVNLSWKGGQPFVETSQVDSSGDSDPTKIE